jgi:hypothetical protein
VTGRVNQVMRRRGEKVRVRVTDPKSMIFQEPWRIPIEGGKTAKLQREQIERERERERDKTRELTGIRGKGWRQAGW